MKILLLGSLVSPGMMEELNSNSTEKASVAPVNYETMLVKGLVENGAFVEAMSVPPVAAYPHSRYMRISATEETLACGVHVHWVPFVNVQVLKQWTIRRRVTGMLKRWLRQHRDDPNKAVMMYSVYPPYSAPAIRLCKKYGCPLTAVITDLPEYMYTWKKRKGLRGWYANRLQKRMLALQTQCDSYVLFTKQMAERLGVEKKPWMVSEGFADASVYEDIPPQEKHNTKTIVYAGNLSRLYGIETLLDGFMMTEGDYELHLYGGGDSTYIEQCAAKDTRIRFFGRVPRDEVLKALKQAHLIVINKPTADDYSNYSFSSKILECMLSGTPVLTTRVGGMPTEYYDYFYFIDDESVAGISHALTTTLERSEKELTDKGRSAQTFAQTEKNYRAMTKPVLEFLEKRASDR